MLWASGPPAGAVAGVLGVATTDPAFAVLVDSWPVAGAQRAILAAWHACRDDRAPGLALLDAVMPMPADAPAWLITDSDNEANSNALYFDPAAARAAQEPIIHRIIALLRAALVQRLGEAKLPLTIPGLDLTLPKGGLGDF